MNPKPLSNAVKNGLAYLVHHQHPDGGWCQGGGWRTGDQGGRVEGPQVADPPDVANTCMATLALLRAGSSPRIGDHAVQVHNGLHYILGCVERSDVESPYITEVRGTQVQTKIGPYADTSLATMLLAEAKGQMGNAEDEARLDAALEKVVAKMERHQNTDGSWANQSWAPVVGQALASAGLNRAKQRGARVNEEVLERSEKYSRSHYDQATKKYTMAGSAGVPLYGTASHLSTSTQVLTSLKATKVYAQKVMAAETATPEEKTRASERLKYLDEAEMAHGESLSSSLADFGDSQFLAGFGSNGGEEFLSYLNISETLSVQGGEEWDKWDQRMTDNLERIQNQDGSWVGHHCITGRTFCTAAALLVLLADRIPRPDVVVA